MNLLDLLKTDLVKTLATLFLFSVIMTALVLYVIDTVLVRAIPPAVNDVLVAAITAALPIVGVHTGVQLANGVATSTAHAVVEEVQKSGILPVVGGSEHA